MAEKLGRTVGMVKSKLNSLRKPRKPVSKKQKVTHYHGYRALARQALKMLPNNTGSREDVYDKVKTLTEYCKLPQHTAPGRREPLWQQSLGSALSRHPEFVSSCRNTVYTYYDPELVKGKVQSSSKK